MDQPFVQESPAGKKTIHDISALGRAAVLLVGDHPSQVPALEEALSDPSYRLISTSSSREALKRLAQENCAVIICDLGGLITDLEFTRRILDISFGEDVPLIILTSAVEKHEALLKAYPSVECLQKPFDPAILQSKVLVFVRLLRQRLQIAELTKKLAEAERELEAAKNLAQSRARDEREFRLRCDAEETTALAMTQNEERLRLAFQAGEVGSWTFETAGRTLHWSTEQEAIFGLAPGSFLGRLEDFLAMIHAEDRDDMRKRLHAAIELEERFESEFRIVRSDGQVRWVTSRGLIYRDSQGRPLRIAGITIDVSRQKESENALRVANEKLQVEIKERERVEHAAQASEGQLRLITDSLPALVAYIEPSRRYQFVNATYENKFGIPRKQIQGRPMAELLGSTAYDDVRPHLDAAFCGKTVHFESHIVNENSAPRWFSVTYVPDCDDVGTVRGVVALVHDITERRRVEDELRMQARVLDSMVEGVSLSDDSGIILYTNPAEDRIFGYEHGELIGQHISVQNSYSAEENMIKVVEVIAHLKKNGNWSGEFSNRKKDGTHFTTCARINTIELSGRTYFVCVQEDITDRKMAKEALQASEERFRLMVEQVKDYGIITTDTRGLVVDWNPSCERITGFSADEMIGKDISIIFTPEDCASQVPRKELEKAERTGSAADIRWHMRKDGSRFWAKGYANALRHADGTLKGFSKILRDESANKRLQDAQNLLDRFTKKIAGSIDYQKALTYMAEAVVPAMGDWCSIDLKDKGGSSRHAVVKHKDPVKEVWLQTLRSLYPPGSREDHPLESVFKEEKSMLLHAITDEVLVSMAQDERHLELLRAIPCETAIIVPLMAHGSSFGTLTLGAAGRERTYDEEDARVLEEIARRGGLALDNARLYFESKEANRLKDEFLAAVSHELRTPLNAMLGFSELILDDYGNSIAKDLRDQVETIHRNALTQKRLVEDLLDISRIISGKMYLDIQIFNLGDVARDSVAAVQVSAKARNISIRQNIEDTGPVNMDSARIQQIIWNLLSNAVKFTPNGGLVEISLGRTESGIQIEVRDTGKGIDPLFLPFIFDRFRQEDGSLTRLSGGLGLGLAITKQLVELHGGTIEARSEGRGQGAVFIVKMPLTA